MSSIINPYRFVGEGPAPGGDYVEISTSATVNVDSGDGDYKYIEFDTSTDDAFEVTDAGGSGSDSIEVYCIGGGGGGGLDASGGGGGGGAGGYLRETSFKNGSVGLAQAYDVTVGGGGSQTAKGNDSQLKDTVSRSLTINGASGGGAFSSWDNTTGNDFNLGSDDYTIECWFNGTMGSSGYGSLCGRTTSGQTLFIYYNKVYYYSNTVLIYSTLPTVVADEWHHVAIVRNGSTFSLYYDGEFYQSSTSSVAETNFSTSTPFRIGTVGGRPYSGLIDNFRVSNTARYTGTTTYTVPFAPFVSDSNTKLLIQPVSSDTGYEDRSSNDWPLTGTLNDDTDIPTMRGFGGGKGGHTTTGGAGGSGAGGGASTDGGAGFLGQGKGGGAASGHAGGGGGGAGAVGADGVDDMDGGDGGEGVTYSWMASNSLGADGGGYYAGGGGGGSDGGVGGTGGTGGGGDGDYYDGTENSGGGGGGGDSSAASGGSGKVIIRWKFQN